jgi:hypothetical protein
MLPKRDSYARFIWAGWVDRWWDAPCHSQNGRGRQELQLTEHAVEDRRTRSEGERNKTLQMRSTCNFIQVSIAIDARRVSRARVRKSVWCEVRRTVTKQDVQEIKVQKDGVICLAGIGHWVW